MALSMKRKQAHISNHGSMFQKDQLKLILALSCADWLIYLT
jgi:hypothetical protein